MTTQLGNLSALASPELFGLLVLGMLIGLIFGILPGLGGKLGLVFLIPFTIGMDPLAGAVFLLAMHAVVHTSGAFPSILFGIPGTGPDAATIIDGFPMTRNGEAGRAIGATLMASGVGGVLGALFLSVLVPFARPIVLAFGPAEFFMFAMLGVTFIAALSGKSLLKGIVVGLFGLLLSTVRLDPLTAEERFSFGQLFLWDGIDTVTAVIAIFAIPEILAFARREAQTETFTGKSGMYAGLWQGCRDVFQHWGLTLRTSVIGAVIGMIPGLGGNVATWLCYGHAVQSSSSPERFGKGAVEGVIAPETANNSKEGGALLPTLFFGIPGSSSMAIMMGAFVALGIQPGPTILNDGGRLVWVLIWTLAIANILAVLLLLLTAPLMTRLASVRSEVLLPFIAILSLAGCYLGSNAWQNFIVFAAIGSIGVLFKLADWPRAPFIVGVILGPMAEVSLHQSLEIWGPTFVFRPFSLLLLFCIVFVIASYAWKGRPKVDAS